MSSHASPSTAIANPESFQRVRSRGDGARRLFRLIHLDFRHGYGLLIVPVLIALGCWYFLGRDQREVVLWGYASTQLSWAFAVIGPVGGAWGTWLAGRDRRSRTEALLASTATPASLHDVRLLTVPVLGSLAVYAGIAAFTFVMTAIEATWGGAGWTVILFGAALIGAYTIVGTIAGIAFPARLTPFVAGIGLLLYTTLSYSYVGINSPYQYLAPFRWVSDPHRYDNVLFHQGSLPASFAVAFALIAGLVAASLGVLALVRARRGTAIGLGVIAAVILAPSVNAALGPGQPPVFAFLLHDQSFGPVENPPLVCGGEIVVTCVHQAFEGQLDEVTAHVDAIVAPVAGLPGVPERLEQRADLLSTGDVVRFIDTWQWGGSEEVIERVTIDALFPSPVLFNSSGYDSEYDRTTAQAAIGLWLAMQAGGGKLYGPFPHEFVGVQHPAEPGAGYDGRPPEPLFEQQMQAHWEEVDRIHSQINTAAERFAALSPEAQRAWLEANWDALRAGELTLEDLP